MLLELFSGAHLDTTWALCQLRDRARSRFCQWSLLQLEQRLVPLCDFCCLNLSLVIRMCTISPIQTLSCNNFLHSQRRALNLKCQTVWTVNEMENRSCKLLATNILWTFRGRTGWNDYDLRAIGCTFKMYGCPNVKFWVGEVGVSCPGPVTSCCMWFMCPSPLIFQHY